MNGADFYALAISLSGGASPAGLRSATSRAYYGAFHRAHELLRSIGIVMPSGPECHKKLRMILDQSGDPDVIGVNAMLASLRIARNNADYELVEQKYEAQKTVNFNLNEAKKIMDCIDSCFAGNPKDVIHDALRKYAKNILRLVIL